MVEVLLALALVLIAVVAFMNALLYTESAGARQATEADARLRLSECAEAVRWIRDSDGFTALTDGAHGLALVGGRWQFSGLSDSVGVFTRRATITALTGNEKTLACTIEWDDGARSISLTTILAK